MKKYSDQKKKGKCTRVKPRDTRITKKHEFKTSGQE